MAKDIYANYLGDPFNNDAIANPKHIQTAGYSGTANDLTAPATANFPEDDTAKTRYIINLPYVPHENLSSYPLLVKDVTSVVTLTRVSGSPGSGEYRLSPSTSKRPNVIEINSAQAGHVISYDLYAKASIMTADYVMGELSMKRQLISKSDYTTWNDLVNNLTGSNTAGAGTFTLPAGYDTTLDIVLIGGGGSGAAGGGNSSGSGGTGGGGGGSSAIPVITTLKYSSPISYTIANLTTGGTAVTNSGRGGNGANGGNSIFGSITSIGGIGGLSAVKPGYTSGTAGGISGDTLNSKPSLTSIAVAAGTAGTANSGVGAVGTELNQDGTWICGSSGAGGGGNNSTSNGGNGGGIGGGIGGSPYGANGGGGGGAVGGSNPYGLGGNGGFGGNNGGSANGGNGSDASGYGSGGGGGGSITANANGTSGKGGNGGQGLLLIYGYRL